MQIQKNISLKPYNTFNVDVKAKFFTEINHKSELIELLKNSDYSSLNKLFIGGGSNILFTKDFDGIVIKLNNSSINIISETKNNIKLKVDAGVSWDRFVEYTVKRNYYGIENLSLIPGNVGAAPIQNIGAYGVEVKDVIESVDIITLNTLEKTTFLNSECKFGYRNSIFKNELKNKVVITSVVFKLSKVKKVNLEYAPLKMEFENKKLYDIRSRDIRDKIISIRQSKLPNPIEIPNAGSFFKNPILSKDKYEEIKMDYPEFNGFPETGDKIKISAGWLIEKCGLKGKRIGNVGIHDKQALVIVNYGNSTGKEIVEFAKTVCSEVKAKFDIELINEVNII